MSESKPEFFYLTLMVMESFRQAGLEEPLTIRPDITDIIDSLPDDVWAGLLPDPIPASSVAMGTIIFNNFYSDLNRDYAYHTDKGWVLTPNGQREGRNLLQTFSKTTLAVKEAVLLYAFCTQCSKETWLSVGEHFGWTT